MTTLTVERTFHFERRGRGAKAVVAGVEPAPAPRRVPRVARLMALALRFECLIKEGAVTNYSELARLGHVTRARVSQVMNLLYLAPDIQEELLFLPPVERGRDPLVLRDLMPIATKTGWRVQRKLWKWLLSESGR
jgi:hypothetical protein